MNEPVTKGNGRVINLQTTLEWPLEGRPTLFSFTLCVSEYNVLTFVIIKIKIKENKKKRLLDIPSFAKAH